MQSVKSLVVLLVMFSQCSPAQNMQENKWELLKSEEGVSVFTRLSSCSKYREFKSVADVQSTMSGLVALLNDFEAYPLWVYRCHASAAVKVLSPNEFIHHQVLSLPWPLCNRDFVVLVKVSQDPATKVVTRTVQSIPGAIAPCKNHVRVRHLKATWTITPNNDGSLHLDYQFQIESETSIPDWLATLAATEGPYTTIHNLTIVLKQEKYQNCRIAYIQE